MSETVLRWVLDYMCLHPKPAYLHVFQAVAVQRDIFGVGVRESRVVLGCVSAILQLRRTELFASAAHLLTHLSRFRTYVSIQAHHKHPKSICRTSGKTLSTLSLACGQAL
eukprot:m.11450 g.11450  ORF g.11450 m.11450 type:complete len:110 (-) comp15502_c0_seq2:417-746(-)